jgi:sulfate transport system permease protein
MAAARTAAPPGFRLTLGVAVLYLTLFVLLPLAACVARASSLSWPAFWAAAMSPEAVAAYKLALGASLAAALLNGLFGLLVAWVLVRYRFPGRRLLDALVDVPLALPTAVAGLTYASLYNRNGWFGQWLGFLEPDGWLGRFCGKDGWFGQHIYPLDLRPHDGPLAIVLVLTFVGLPFMVRALQPVLAELEPEQEEAAASLGAGRWQRFRHIILPALLPAWLTGFALVFARALGEYGSVVFVASNLPFQTQIPPVLVVSKLDQFRYAEAAAVAVVLLVLSLLSLIAINLLGRWSNRHGQGQ